MSIIFQDNIADTLKAWIQTQIHLTSEFILFITILIITFFKMCESIFLKYVSH